MRLTRFVARLSGPLLVLSEQAAAQNQAHLEVTEVKKVTDPLQGGFRPFVDFTVAGQAMRGLLDTGSSDWMIPKTGSDFCKGAGEQCDGLKTGFKAGSFDLAKAGTQVRDLNVTFKASYTGGASFGGVFIEAPLQVSTGGKAVPAQLGLLETGGVPHGQVSFPVLGVGPVAGECAQTIYTNVPAQFKASNKIKVNAFGLYLGDFRSPHSGSLVWGGYDAAKFDGKLTTAPLVKTKNGEIPSFVVDLSSVRLTPSTGSKVAGTPTKGNPANQKIARSLSYGHSRISASDYEHTRSKLSGSAIFRREQSGNILSNEVPPVVWLDTGVPGIILPEGTLKKLNEALGGRMGSDGEFLVDCKRIAGMDLVIGMNKEAIQIRVPLESITPINEPPNGGTCTLLLAGVTAQSGGIPVLGAPALQHMYVVFDMDSEALLIAQAKPDETKVDIREYIPAGRAQ
ncbi:hypothetical protein E4U55_007093 [Claviceps digitariae]|nr:hypothetical protein E4U55_007093 [Claviceps digitariae]